MTIHYLMFRQSDNALVQRGMRPDDTDPIALLPPGYYFETIQPNDPRWPPLDPALGSGTPNPMGWFDMMFEAMDKGEIPKAVKFYEAYKAFRNRIPP